MITVCVPKMTRRVIFCTQTVILVREPAGDVTEPAIDAVMTSDNTSTSQGCDCRADAAPSQFIGGSCGLEELGVVGLGEGLGCAVGRADPNAWIDPRRINAALH